MAINAYVSDLFFNLDHSEAEITTEGKFTGFDEKALRPQAEWFCEAISAITGGSETYNADEIVKDFLDRL